MEPTFPDAELELLNNSAELIKKHGAENKNNLDRFQETENETPKSG